MNMRPILTLTLLLTCAGLSAQIYVTNYPFEMMGFYPDMPEADFDSLAKAYGAIGESEGVYGGYHFFSGCSVTWMEHLDMGAGKKREREEGEEMVCHRSEMSKFTVGGQPVYSVSQAHYESRALWSIDFTLHTENTEKYVRRLKELFTDWYGAPEPSEDGFKWEIVTLWHRESMVLSSETLSLNRVDFQEKARIEQSELEDF